MHYVKPKIENTIKLANAALNLEQNAYILQAL